MANKFIPTVRSAARALIIQDERLLAVAMRDEKGAFFILPGGGQRHGETLVQTIHRECLEELGVAVEVGELLYVREYVGRNHDFCKRHKNFHQLETVFCCRLRDPDAVFNTSGAARDKLQTGIAWVPLDTLETCRFYPAAIKPFFHKDGIEIGPQRYLGDIN